MFPAQTPSWAAVAGTFPPGWEPDALLVWTAYTSPPAWIWSAPVPVVLLAADANLLWHAYRYLLPLADLVLTDAPSADRLRRAGLMHVREANLFGLDCHFLAGIDAPDAERDVDLLFVGNLNPAVQPRRLPWLGRLAAFSDRCRVVIAGGVYGADYRSLLRRAKVMFNHSVRNECNLRAFEAAASGAVLLQEADNAEVRNYLEPHAEYVPYTGQDFEAVVERLLADDTERRGIASRAKARVRGYAFDTLVEAAVGVGGPGWEAVRERAARRAANPPRVPLTGRAWVRASCSGPNADSTLAADLSIAEADHALALFARSPAEAEPLLARAAENRVAAIGHATALAELGRSAEAVAVLRAVLADLDARPELATAERDTYPYPARFDHLRVGWDRAGYAHPDDLAAETATKVALLRCRARTLLAALTDDLAAYRAAAEAASADFPAARAALGCALARAGLFPEAAAELAAAWARNPFDRAAARALVQALTDAGDAEECRRVTATLRRLSAAAPTLFPAEPWFADPEPPEPSDVGLASLVILCCNEVEVTRLCLESVLAHTRPPYELVLVDNGSTDDTPACLAATVRRPGPERVTVVTNGRNLGYPGGVNQGLALARGESVVLLNNDVVVTPGWLDRLERCAEVTGVGLAGPVTNYAPPPQLVEAGYTDLGGLEAFAARRAMAFARQILDVPRLTGFCLLVRREVFDRVGRLDERFGLGFFDDDDLCLRARRAGFRLTVALDCYVHHFGSRTFRGLGVDAEAQLAENLARYRDKWGPEEAARYQMPPDTVRPDHLEGAPEPLTVLSDAPTVTPPVPAVAKGRPRVSLTMIVKNEEKHLPDCLASVRDLVDEVVVIDTGSTDRTQEVARSFGAVVGEFPWVDDFAAARNVALDHATGDYAFWMDADDRLDEENRAQLKALFGSLTGGNDAYVVKCLCVPDKPGAGGTVVDHVRVFRRVPAHRWSYRVHEQILPALRKTKADVRWSGVTVQHVGYVDATVRRRKLDRDLRLLMLDEQDRPGDPFTLFNLGSVYNELGDPKAAAEALSRSLAASHPRDSIVRKLYALLTQCHARAGDRAKALATCAEGRGHYPEDAELIFLAAGLAREGRDYRTAEELYRTLITGQEADHFASVDVGLRVVKGRHNLAVLLTETDRPNEAEGLWRAVLTADPAFLPAHVGLGDLSIRAKNEPALARQLAALRELGSEGDAEAAVLESRWFLNQGEHTRAAHVLEDARKRCPGAVGVRMALSHVHIAADSPPEVLEAAFQGVLELDPHNDQARRNLEVLYRKTGR